LLLALAIVAIWLFWPVVFVPLVLWVYVLWFFRDPQRITPPGPGLFISPADGRVSDITNVGAESELGRKGVKVGIFMNVFNVHVNRNPACGWVESIEHRSGTLLDVRDPHAWERNESMTIRMVCDEDGREFPFIVRQIAGLVARRIVTDIAEGQTLARGQRIGMIKFGSRLELTVPQEFVSKVCVKIGQHVKAGETILIESGERE